MGHRWIDMPESSGLRYTCCSSRSKRSLNYIEVISLDLDAEEV